MTLIEVMMALMIALIVFFGLMETARVAVGHNAGNALRDEAVSIGEEKINLLRRVPFATLAAMPTMLPSPYTDNVTRQFRRMNVTFAVTGTHTALGSNLDQVMFTVTWPHIGRPPFSHTFTTIVRQ